MLLFRIVVIEPDVALACGIESDRRLTEQAHQRDTRSAGNLLRKLQEDFRQARERVGHGLEIILDVAERHALNGLE